MEHLSNKIVLVYNPIAKFIAMIIRDYYEKGGVITGIITPAQTVETPMRAPEGRRPEGARSGSRPFEKGVIIPLHPDFFVIIFLS